MSTAKIFVNEQKNNTVIADNLAKVIKRGIHWRHLKHI